MVINTTPHIWLDGQSRAWIDDTNVKVIEVALDHLAYGWSAEEMQRQHAHLSLAQAYAALAYYYDHKTEFDRQIEESLRRVETLASQADDAPLLRRLRAAGKL
jgi:uncharacterized protein (DUF433 family)